MLLRLTFKAACEIGKFAHAVMAASRNAIVLHMNVLFFSLDKIEFPESFKNSEASQQVCAADFYRGGGVMFL